MSDTTIQAIPTRYAGCHFRSRLEARWAVFFDALGIRWEYEPEGFVGAYGEPYLPDFQLPEVYMPYHAALEAICDCARCEAADSGVYVEVKPTKEQLHADGRKMGCCIDYQATPLSRSGLLILGPIPDPRHLVPVHPILRWQEGVELDHVAFRLIDDEEGTPDWTLDYVGDSYSLDGCDGDSGLPRTCTPIASSLNNTTGLLWAGTTEIVTALTAARSARFEHGERGAT